MYLHTYVCPCIRTYVRHVQRYVCMEVLWCNNHVIVCLCITTHLCPEAHSHTHRTHTHHPSLTFPKAPFPIALSTLKWLKSTACNQRQAEGRQSCQAHYIQYMHAYIHGVLVDLVERFDSQLLPSSVVLHTHCTRHTKICEQRDQLEPMPPSCTYVRMLLCMYVHTVRRLASIKYNLSKSGLIQCKLQYHNVHTCHSDTMFNVKTWLKYYMSRLRALLC